MNKLSKRWLHQFKKANQIAITGRDDQGNYYGLEGCLNQAAWAGEHCHLLIREIERLRRKLKKAGVV